MKHLLTFLILFSCIAASAQTTQKPAIDTSKRYAVILNENEINALFALIRIADEKPSVINAWLQLIGSRAIRIDTTKKDQPKK